MALQFYPVIAFAHLIGNFGILIVGIAYSFAVERRYKNKGAIFALNNINSVFAVFYFKSGRVGIGTYATFNAFKYILVHG